MTSDIPALMQDTRHEHCIPLNAEENEMRPELGSQQRGVQSFNALPVGLLRERVHPFAQSSHIRASLLHSVCTD